MFRHFRLAGITGTASKLGNTFRDDAWMAPRSTTNKAKAAGIGASSFLDLKAELAAKEKEVAENRASGKKTISSGQKPGKVCVPPSRSSTF